MRLLRFGSSSRTTQQGRLRSSISTMASGRRSRGWPKRLPQSGVVLADEVGTGKTRIACAVVHAVLKAGGRAAVVVPHGLMHQWIAESRKLRASSPAPKELTTFTEFLREVSPNEASWKDFSPRPDESEWWLISHGFRAPLVRSNSYCLARGAARVRRAASRLTSGTRRRADADWQAPAARSRTRGRRGGAGTGWRVSRARALRVAWSRGARPRPVNGLKIYACGAALWAGQARHYGRGRWCLKIVLDI